MKWKLFGAWILIIALGIVFWLGIGLLCFKGCARADVIGYLTPNTPGKISKHFYYKEYACKCCGATKINIELIIACEKLRIMANAPVIITSGYRCPKHNAQVKGARYSQHCLGNAVDIKVIGYTPTQVAQLARRCGFTWIKVYPNWTHCDVRAVK